MNPSPAGGFMEGISRGVSGGMENYVKLAMAKIDQQQRSDQADAEMNYKLFADTNMPLAIRKKAYAAWQKTNKAWNTGLGGMVVSDDMWENKGLNTYFQRGKKIFGNKEYSLPNKIKFLAELESEAISTMGGQAAGMFKPLKENIQTQALQAGVGMLDTGTLPGQPTQARGLLALSPTGRDILKGQAKPIPKPTPSVPMYKVKNVDGNKLQTMQWNPSTGKNDIPYGKPVTVQKAIYRNLGSSIYKITDKGAKRIQQGSTWERAVFSAMKDPMWSFWSESEQLKAIEKYERLILRKPAPSSPAIAPQPKQTSLLGKVGNALFPKQSQQIREITGGQVKPPSGMKTKLTREVAVTLLKAANGNKDLARKMAREQGYMF